MRVRLLILAVALIALGLDPALGAPRARGILATPIPAPEWKVSKWIHGNPGTLADQRGREVLIDFFQLWCPGCNRFSIPLFQRWNELYGDRDDVVIVSIHTVFEGHASQTPERLRDFVEEKGISHPVGIDAYADPGDTNPLTMRRFATGGTPHVAIVDQSGQLRFSHFGSFDPASIEAFINELLTPPQSTTN